MKIGILSKSTTTLTGDIKQFFENKNFKVEIYTHKNLNINKNLLNNDFYILKSKNLFFLYAGFFLEANGIPVIPNPQDSFIQKNRVHSHFHLRRIGLLTPEIYLGAPKTLKEQLKPDIFPLILKPILGSSSKGVKIINSSEELESLNQDTLYLEKFIRGTHYTVYFIDNHICTLIKAPLVNEHVDMEKVDTPYDIRRVITKWRYSFLNRQLFGHLDIVREESSRKLYVVDPGSFPEFSNWKCRISPVKNICNLILYQAEELMNKHNN
ncbi:MAG: ATP-grasp domain-containing protein [Promethearchaeota archaeon]